MAQICILASNLTANAVKEETCDYIHETSIKSSLYEYMMPQASMPSSCPHSVAH